MSWEYLEQMSFRHAMVVPYVNVVGKHAIELNCGRWTMLPWLDGQASYAANDLSPTDWVGAIGETPKRRFFQMGDDTFVPLVQACDVLFLFGHGGYEIDCNPKESATVSKSAMTLMGRFSPAQVVLESVQKYAPCLHAIVEGAGYSIQHQFLVDAGEGWTFKRMVVIAGRG